MKTSFCGILSALLPSDSRLPSLFLESSLVSFTGSQLTISCRTCIMELKQRRRRRKCHLKGEFLLPQLYRAYSISFNLWANFSGVECWKTSSKFGKRKRKLLSCVSVLDKTWIKALSRCSRTMTAKKCTKQRDARAKLLFC